MQPLIVDGIEYRWYNHLFAVSAAGNVLKRGRTLTPRVRPDGYLEIGRGHLLHRMVAHCWVAKPEGAEHVHHVDGNKRRNHADNLEWVTPKQHIAERHAGTNGRHVVSDEAKEKLRAYRLGRVTSEETKQKQREASLRLGLRPPPMLPGEEHSFAAKEKMRLNSPNAAACEINGTRYRSFSEAGRALGMKPHTLRKRCLSGSFSGYRIVKSG